MSGLRWTEEQLADYERRQRSNGRPLGALDLPTASRNDEQPRASARAKAPRGVSRLESALLGNFAAMGLKAESQYRFHPERKWRLDFAFPDVLVAVEIDGGIFAAENGGEAGKHARGAGRCADMEKRNAAAELGWLVLNYGPPHVRSGEAALQVERLVAARRASLAAGGPPFALTREVDGVGAELLEQKKPRKRVGRRARKRDAPALEVGLASLEQIG